MNIFTDELSLSTYFIAILHSFIVNIQIESMYQGIHVTIEIGPKMNNSLASCTIKATEKHGKIKSINPDLNHRANYSF